MVKQLAKLSLVAIWKIENVPSKLVGLPRNISKQNVESILCLHPYKFQEERYDLRKEMTNFQAELFFQLHMQIRLYSKHLCCTHAT